MRAHILVATRTAVLMRYKEKAATPGEECVRNHRMLPNSQLHTINCSSPSFNLYQKETQKHLCKWGILGRNKGHPGWEMAEKRWPNFFRQPAWKLWEFSSALENIDFCLCYSSHRCFKLKPPSPATTSPCPHSGTGLPMSCVSL